MRLFLNAFLLCSVLTGASAAENFQFTHTPHAPLPSGEVGADYLASVQTTGAESSVTFTASNLPPGLSLDVNSGLISGTPTAPGAYPVSVSAQSGTETIADTQWIQIVPSTRNRDISGGTQNLFINSMSVANSQTPGKASWKATCRYNEDRTGSNGFSPTTNPQDNFVATIATHTLIAPASGFKKSGNTFTFKSASGVVPVVSVTIDTSAEKITLSMTKDTFEAPLGGQTVPVTFALGSTQYALNVTLDNNGTLKVTPGYQSVSFAGTTGKADLFAPGFDVLDFDAVLADPNFHFTPGPATFPVVVKLTINGNLVSVVNIDQGSFTTTEQNGKIFYKIASASILKKTKFFTYDSKTGKMAMTLSQLTLSSLVEVSEPMGIEIILDGQDYVTTMTMFRWNSHTFKKSIP